MISPPTNQNHLNNTPYNNCCCTKKVIEKIFLALIMIGLFVMGTGIAVTFRLSAAHPTYFFIGSIAAAASGALLSLVSMIALQCINRNQPSAEKENAEKENAEKAWLDCLRGPNHNAKTHGSGYSQRGGYGRMLQSDNPTASDM